MYVLQIDYGIIICLIDKKWGHILKKIDAAVADYTPCEEDENGCSTCHYK